MKLKMLYLTSKDVLCRSKVKTLNKITVTHHPWAPAEKKKTDIKACGKIV